MEIKEIIEKYPRIKLKDKSMKLEIIGDDLFCISKTGRIEIITSAKINRCKFKKAFWFELEVKSFVLVDEGMNPEELRI